MRGRGRLCERRRGWRRGAHTHREGDSLPPRAQLCMRYCSNKQQQTPNHSRRGPSARSLSRSPSPSPPSFTQSPSPHGQTSPHRPRLVVSRSTCPPLSETLRATQTVFTASGCATREWTSSSRRFFFFISPAPRQAPLKPDIKVTIPKCCWRGSVLLES
jgi:hypothetical protein